MPEISILSVSVDSPEWAELLIQSVRKFTKVEHEIIVVDNGSLPVNLAWLREQPDVRLCEMTFNIGHGAALDYGTMQARGRFVCAIDIDAHFQRPGWDVDLIGIYRTDPRLRLIGCKGPDHKPLKPPLFFFDREFILRNQLSFRHIPGISTDTAQKIYWDILSMGFNVTRFIPGFKVYKSSGDQFYVNDKPTFHHNWYGTRFNENNPAKRKDELDGYTFAAFKANKDKLFAEPLVQEILRHS